MTRILAPAILALAFAVAPASAETRNLSGFTGVQARDGVEVVVSIGERYRVDVTGRDTDRVRTRVRGDSLEISQMNRPWWGNHDLDATIHVVMPRVDGLSAARGAEVRADNITARDMSISAAMGGVIEISGTCSDLDASVAMGGVLEADDFQCQTADVSAAMGGVAEVFASNTFDASASMGGTIDIAGGASGDASSAMGGTISHGN
jgi:hypothetical protein